MQLSKERSYSILQSRRNDLPSETKIEPHRRFLRNLNAHNTLRKRLLHCPVLQAGGHCCLVPRPVLSFLTAGERGRLPLSLPLRLCVFKAFPCSLVLADENHKKRVGTRLEMLDVTLLCVMKRDDTRSLCRS